MESIAAILVVLIAAGTLYAVVKTVLTIRRVGIKRFGSALLVFIMSVLSSLRRLFTGSFRKNSSDDPFDFSGTGTHYNARTGNHDNGQDPFGNYPFDKH